MFGWLAKKNEDARVYMCVKEVKWDIEKSDELRRAVILVMAHIQRIGMSEDEDLKRIIDNPFAFDRRDAVFLYVRLEDLRNTIRLQNTRGSTVRTRRAASKSACVQLGQELTRTCARMFAQSGRCCVTLCRA
jgi:hypothetical protein